jgi:putative ABC transport system substrate-binding protein
MEFCWADDQLDRLPLLAADLVRRRPAVIVAAGAGAPVAKEATSTIPIVFITGADPIETGLVNSLSRPIGNVTGVSFSSTALYPKRLELLHELVPKVALIGALLDSNLAGSEDRWQDLDEAAKALGRQIVIVRAPTESDIDPGFQAVAQAGCGALFVGAGAFYISQRHRLVALAARHALPATYAARAYVEVGGLMSYGAGDVDASRRAGVYVGRILKGTKPGDLPVELPTKYELTINLKTARALKLDIPPKLLALADEVIE